MKSVIAFDVSMGHSYMVVYDAWQHCIFEGDITHARSAFEDVRIRIEAQRKQDGVLPAIVFEATGVYSKALERFIQACGFEYALLNPLAAKMPSTPSTYSPMTSSVWALLKSVIADLR